MGLFTESFIFPQCVHDLRAFSKPFSWTLNFSSVPPLKPILTDVKGLGARTGGTSLLVPSFLVLLGGNGTHLSEWAD